MVQRGNSNSRDVYVRQLSALLRQHHDAEALRVAEALPTKFKSDSQLLFLHATALERAKKWDKAIDRAKRSLRVKEHPNAHLLIAHCHKVLGETEEALQSLDRAERLSPGLEQTVQQRSGVLEAAGRFDEATAILAELVERKEASGTAIRPGLRIEWSKLLVQNKRLDEAIAFIDVTLGMSGLPAPMRARQFFLKAKALDRKREYAAAAEAAARANEIDAKPFDPSKSTSQVDRLMRDWSREKMATYPISTCDSEIPVFVAGMPRSGTSLVDQIIDAHPKAAGVGELDTIERFATKISRAFDPSKPDGKQFGSIDSFRWTRAADDYVRSVKKLAPEGAERVANKALSNFLLLGVMSRLFPKMRVIHMIRDPRDVAVSCFMGDFNNYMHPWTVRVDWAAQLWCESMRLMDHWKSSFDVPILDVYYENLVADPEHEFPRLVEFLGLEWDDRCFGFHETKRTVHTLSYDQVNRPLYTSSCGRHKHYASLLEGVEFPAYDPTAAR